MSSKDKLAQARECLLHGIRLARQRSYQRRAPARIAIPHLVEARRQLLDLLQQDPVNDDALILLSEAEEVLLNYTQAIRYLERAMNNELQRTKKNKKRLAALRQYAAQWEDLGLSPQQLAELGKHLAARGVSPVNRSLELTREWLQSISVANADDVIAALHRRGAFSDFQVLANVVWG